MSEPLIIGSGPAGSAAAIGLARAGARPVIVERSRETGDAICGGFLSWQTVAALNRLGIDADRLGGQPITRVRLFAGRQSTEARLPAAGMGLSRRALDTIMLSRAISAGAGIERGVHIKAIATGEATTSDGGRLMSDALFLASGKHALPGQPRPAATPVATDPVVGLRLRIGPSKALDRMVGDAVELFLFDRGYAGLVRQEDGSGNLCLAVHKSRLHAEGGRPEALIAAWGRDNPQLGERIASGTAIGPIDAIAAVPYGWRALAGTPGVWRLGDQAGVIPSLAGEGMGIALATAESAVTAWRQKGSAEVWQTQMAARLRRPMAVAGWAWSMAENPRWNGFALAALDKMPGMIGVLARLTRIAP